MSPPAKRRHSMYTQFPPGPGVADCGHQARFIMTYMDGAQGDCALCLLEDSLDDRDDGVSDIRWTHARDAQFALNMSKVSGEQENVALDDAGIPRVENEKWIAKRERIRRLAADRDRLRALLERAVQELEHLPGYNDDRRINLVARLRRDGDLPPPRGPTP